MPQKTNLDYVQDILSALDSDEVNSVSDTVESAQVLRILKRTYDSIVTRADLHEHYTLFQLEASGTSTKPTLMTRPSDVSSILWVKYNKETSTDTDDAFSEITFLPLGTFLSLNHQLDETDSTVGTITQTIGTSNIKFYYEKNRAPTYYTTYDDSTLIFDAFDQTVEATLQKSKTMCYGKKDQSFLSTDSFVPFLDVEFGTLLLNEALVTAFAELKQIPNEVARMWASRAWTKVSKHKRGIDQNRKPIEDQVNYGRK